MIESVAWRPAKAVAGSRRDRLHVTMRARKYSCIEGVDALKSANEQSFTQSIGLLYATVTCNNAVAHVTTVSLRRVAYGQGPEFLTRESTRRGSCSQQCLLRGMDALSAEQRSCSDSNGRQDSDGKTRYSLTNMTRARPLPLCHVICTTSPTFSG